MTTDKNIEQSKKQNSANPRSASRRRAVKTIAGGVGALAAYHVLPVHWSKPIVEQIFLPAHAAVSGITLSDPCSVELISGDQATSIDVIRVSGFVTPPVGGLSVAIAAAPNGGSGGTVEAFTTTDSSGNYSAEITLAGPGVVGVAVSTGIAGARNTASCSIGIPPAQQPQPPSTTAAPNPDFTAPAGAVLITISNPSTTGEILSGSLNPGNGDVPFPFTVLPNSNDNAAFTYSAGNFTLSWTDNGSTGTVASIEINGTTLQFNPQQSTNWILQVT